MPSSLCRLTDAEKDKTTGTRRLGGARRQLLGLCADALGRLGKEAGNARHGLRKHTDQSHADALDGAAHAAVHRPLHRLLHQPGARI